MSKRKAKVRKRLRTVCGHSYPVGDSVQRIKEAGGIHQIPEEERAALDIKQVAPGGWIDDMPPEPRPALLGRGKIEWVEVDDDGNEIVAPTPKKKSTKKKRRPRRKDGG